MKGNDDGNILSGLKGNDTIWGFAKGDAIYGGSGNDIIRGGRGDDAFFSLIDPEGATHYGIFVDPETEFALGGLWGGPGDDEIFGGRGSDHIYGGMGQDKLTGGRGNDVFHFEVVDSLPGAKDIIRDFGRGRDAIDLSDFTTPINVTIVGKFVRIDDNGDGLTDVVIKVKGEQVAEGDLIL